MNNATVYPGVTLGKNVKIGPFCIIGLPFTGIESEMADTVIGDNANIRSHTIIYAGNTIGDNFSTGHHAVIRELNTIGDDVSVGTHSCLEHHIEIGNGVRIHSQAFIPEYSRLHEDSWIGPNVVMTNANYPRSLGIKDSLDGITLEKKAIVGANSTLLPGIVIGRCSLVGAGSVVTRDVEAGCVVAGNPAVMIKSMKDIDVYKDWLNEHTADES